VARVTDEADAEDQNNGTKLSLSAKVHDNIVVGMGEDHTV